MRQPTRIGFAEYVEYAEGRLSRERRLAVEAALLASPQALAMVERIRRVIQTLEADDTCAPTPQAVRRALAVFQPRPAAAERAEAGRAALAEVPRLIARLVLDSRGEPALAGFRGEGESYELTYEAEAVRLEMQVTESDVAGTCRVCGQVSAPDAGGVAGAVSLQADAGARTVAVVAVDDTGWFRLDAAPGTYHVSLELDGLVVIAPGVEVE